jgi:hypothetical protein
MVASYEASTCMFTVVLACVENHAKEPATSMLR